MTTPSSSDYLRPGGDPGIAVLAHRGVHGQPSDWLENTLQAFAAARRAGADGVELDVRRTADGALAVHHDEEVPDVGPLAELRRDELPPWLPTLDEALDECAGLLVNVEIKLDHPPAAGDEAPLAALVEGVRRTVAAGPARCTISSFWSEPLALFGGPGDPPTGLLVHPARSAPAAVTTAASLGCAALHPFVAAVTPALVTAAHGAGLAVVTWTVNRPDQLEQAQAAGVDAVITDDVPTARAVLGR